MMSEKVTEAVWLIRTMTSAELLELKNTLGDKWLPPPPDIGVREPKPSNPGGHEAGAVAE